MLAAPLTIEITEGVAGALPMAVVPFGGLEDPGAEIAATVADDLRRSGRFKPMPVSDMLARPHNSSQVQFRDWRVLGMEDLVVGEVLADPQGGYTVRFQLFDVFRGEQLMGYSIPTPPSRLRATAHRISDMIYERLTGEPGAFSTRIAYVTSVMGSDNKLQYSLNVADADGYGQQTVVRSSEPLMSPAWSPQGDRLAYVSFEGKASSIYVQNVATGDREKLVSFKGINGAPAWSPDGRKLAVTLSRDGNPEIYVLSLADKTFLRLTNNFAIDTEAAWSPDGRNIVFTSDRGGKPQIYMVSASGGTARRVTFEGDYNARASYSPDGKLLTMVTRDGGNYRIGVLDLARGLLTVLSDGKLDESPSFAPNGSMIIYATENRGQAVLAAVSVDGQVRQRLALQGGNVREPAWSPFSKP